VEEGDDFFLQERRHWCVHQYEFKNAAKGDDGEHVILVDVVEAVGTRQDIQVAKDVRQTVEACQ